MAAYLNRIAELIVKFHREQLVPEEQSELDEWIASSAEHEKLFQELTDDESLRAELEAMSGYQEAVVREKIETRFPLAFSQATDAPYMPVQAETPIHSILPAARLRRLAAACILLLIAGAAYVYLYNNPRKEVAKTAIASYKIDIAPGGNKAMLTLGNGQKIVLDSAANGILAQQGSAKVVKLNNGQLAYNAPHKNTAGILYNTLTTPRGGQYRLTLPDGTKVWLNAASSIRYPTAFDDRYRMVTITGEAYFEVVKDASRPFRVSANGRAEIDVLGTDFNVNAYEDETALKTTLLKGAVEVNGLTLRPGEQASINVLGQTSLVRNADADEVMAWKNGLFQFDRSDIHTVMRQISRWYDVDITYNGTIPQHFGGTISRNVNVSQVLQMLEATGAVKFNIGQKKIEVTP